MGNGPRLAQGPLRPHPGHRRRRQGHPADELQGDPRLALDRRRERGQGQHRPARQCAGDGALGPRGQQPDPRDRDEEGDGEARSHGHRRSLPDPRGGHERSQGRDVPPSGLDPVRDLRIGHRVEPLDPVARPGRRSGVGVAPRSHHHGEVRAQARLRRTSCSGTSRSTRPPTSRTSRTSPARSTRGCGRSATPARAPSG